MFQYGLMTTIGHLKKTKVKAVPLHAMQALGGEEV
jgi:hypothetical protein